METPKQKWRQTDLLTPISFHRLSQNKREVIAELLAQMMKEMIQKQRKIEGEQPRYEQNN